MGSVKSTQRNQCELTIGIYILKTITCKDLGGACDLEFSANTFEEIADLSKQHAMEMFQKQDSEHLEAMSVMQERMKKPEEMHQWFESKRKMFENLPEN
ncbi:MAG: putative small metal-binding protein [Paraglaciecola sp.]|jgi:predicted small metal-binding protein